jgi:hypothetical protein
MSRKTTDIDTLGKHAPRESQVVLQDGRVLYAQRWVRTRRTVTAVLVVLGILVALGLTGQPHGYQADLADRRALTGADGTAVRSTDSI